MIAHLIAKIKKVFEKNNTIFLQCSSVNGIVKDIEMLHPNNIISKPHKNKNALVLELNQNRSVVIGFEGSNTSLKIKEGEITIYSTDKNGTVKSKMHLTDKGEILTDAQNKIITNGSKIELNGNSKNFVTYAELDIALQKFIVKLNSHTHVTPSGTSVTPLPVMSLDISKSKTTTIVTGG